MKLFPNFQLKTRIAIVSALGIVMVAASLLFYSTQNAQKQMIQAARARAVLITQTNAHALSIPMWDFNEEHITSVMNNMARDLDFQYGRVLDDTGALVAEAGIRLEPDARVIQIDEPITYQQGNKKHGLGILTVQLNMNQSNTALRDHLVITAAVYSLVVLGISILIYRLLSHALKPLGTLSRVMHDYAQGNRTTEIIIRNASPEIQALVETFDEMRYKVDNYQTQLEHEVQVRTKELEKATALAESASRTKSTFLATMGHEIRTPLNGIIGMADLLSRRNLGEKENQFAKIILRSSQTLLLMINEILDFSKAEAGKLVMNIGDVNVTEIVQDSMALMQSLAEEKSLQLVIDIRDDVVATGDAQYVKQTLLNLVNNAIKFTKEGSVTVRLEYRDNKAIVSIIDTGIGISPNDQKRLFQSFSQIDDGSDRRYEGTGLGLAICRRFIEQMGGSIGVESEAGKGSRFWFALNANSVCPIPHPANS
ncbi:MAG: sensor histidine kinase [Rickettsiales bacterium]